MTIEERYRASLVSLFDQFDLSVAPAGTTNFEVCSALDPCERCGTPIVLVRTLASRALAWYHIYAVEVDLSEREVTGYGLSLHTPEICLRARQDPEWRLPWADPSWG